MSAPAPRARRVRWVIVAAIAVVAAVVWRAQLVEVDRSAEGPRPLVSTPGSAEVQFEVTLPAVPVGLETLRPGGRAMLVHYWAPWERHGASQIRTLDSLAREIDPARLRIVVVCFDPFPSVARFVARQRIRTPVLLDRQGALRRALACPSLPFTYAIDANRRVRIAQSGEVDWLSTGTRRALAELSP